MSSSLFSFIISEHIDLKIDCKENSVRSSMLRRVILLAYDLLSPLQLSSKIFCFGLVLKEKPIKLLKKKKIFFFMINLNFQ